MRDVGIKDFATSVMDESRQRLVVVDFWAPWCGPCKQLGPLLEKAVQARKGAVLLAKVNIDENPQLAQQLRVQSVPTVYAFFNGQVVDGFMGAVPESQITAWLDQLVASTGSRAPGDDGLSAALKQAQEWLDSGAIAKAEPVFQAILAQEPENAEAFAGSLRCLMARGETVKASELLAAAPPALAQNKALAGVRSALELARQSAQADGDVAALEKRVQADPNDHAARFDLALALYAAGNHERAVDSLLEIVSRDRAWREEAARKQLVKMFEAFGAADPLTIAARRRLSSILFS